MKLFIAGTALALTLGLGGVSGDSDSGLVQPMSPCCRQVIG